MDFKLLQSVLCLVSMSALFTGGALAQAGNAADLRGKLARDYNAGKYREVIADAAALKKLNASNSQIAMLAAQSYYRMGDYAGCSKYIEDSFGASPSGAPWELLTRCKKGR